MKNQLTTTQPEASLGLVRRAEELIRSGQRSGNFGLVTSSKVCSAIATMDAAGIHATLLEEMGIRAEVSEVHGGMMIEVTEHHGLNAIMNACRTFFDVIGVMGRNGRKAIRVSIPKALSACESPPMGDAPCESRRQGERRAPSAHAPDALIQHNS